MICATCVYKSSLKEFISESGTQGACTYCDDNSICVEDGALSNFMNSRIEKFLVPTDQLSEWDKTEIYEINSGYPQALELWEFFEDYTEFAVDEFMAGYSDSLPVEKDNNNNTILYVLDDGNLDELNEFETRWKNFNLSIRHDLRFFNSNALEFCEGLFDGIIEDGKLEESIIYMLTIDDQLYRARIALNKKEIKEIADDPVSQLGCVPSHLANSQRMTPDGISSFYGAFDRDTCISELRPLVGDVVISGEFRPNRALNLLNLNALENVEQTDDVFAEGYRKRAHARAFFKELVFQLSRPSSRSGRYDYLATQVIFEFLNTRFDREVHGVRYASVQSDGMKDCFALFPKFSEVNSGYAVIANDEVFPNSELTETSLFFVNESIKYHRLRSASYDGSEHDSMHALMLDDNTLRKIFPSERY